ncbi:MAG TPA: hypothetical protein VHU84_16410 [Lacipirellulaceae bacterium]|nr:hypothetical protein [Lacipirellulaceae bacterium]
MVRASIRFALFGFCALVAALVFAGPMQAQAPQGGNGGQPNSGPSNGTPPVYQRQAFDWRRDNRDRRRNDFRQQQWMMPQVSAGSFQRPYPYHLDYYKMRYGGSYAPYFGNLYGTPYGTPQVVNGGYGPGGWGGDGGAYPPQEGYEGAAGYPGGVSPRALMNGPVQSPPQNTNQQATTQSQQPEQQSQQQQKDVTLPPPSP